MVDFKIFGVDVGGIYYLREKDDVDKLVEEIGVNKGGEVVVVGGGYIGVELVVCFVFNLIRVIMVFFDLYFSEIFIYILIVIILCVIIEMCNFYLFNLVLK